MATSSTDIVKRLRKFESGGWLELAAMLHETADEIERLHIERDTWRNNANAWADLAIERGGNLNVDHAKEILRLRAALKSIAYDVRSPRQTARRAMEALGDE